MGQRTYNAYTLKSSKMASLILRMPHRIILYMPNARNRSNGQVMVQDMSLKYCGVNHMQVNMTRWLFTLIHYIHHEKH